MYVAHIGIQCHIYTLGFSTSFNAGMEYMYISYQYNCYIVLTSDWEERF